MTGLPEEFKEKMKNLLGEEYSTFIASYDREPVQGLRMNLLKVSEEEGDRLFGCFGLSRIPWVREGRFYEKDTRPGRHIFHEAGLYYIQEPSAMAVVSLLDPKPGDKVLDLCAAPGGKTTHIASRIGKNGFLLSNEIHPARAKILSQNVERMGIGNGVVTNEDPKRLTRYFHEFFDKIVVDAPCSGEGMFRKDETARNEWSLENVNMCADRQEEILNCAASMLKKGGTLVYSTCTFSPEEDEQSVERFLKNNPEFYIADCSGQIEKEGITGLAQGRPEWGETQDEELKKTFRIWPQQTEGEGHYIAVLRKREEDGETSGENRKKERKGPGFMADRKNRKSLEDFIREICPEAEGLKKTEGWILFGDQLYLLPADMPDMKGMKVIRPGLHVAELKKNRLEPAHALAKWLKKEEAARACELSEDEALRYLKGETVQKDGEKGWTLACFHGYPLGWAKETGGTLKNHYPKGLRIQG